MILLSFLLVPSVTLRASDDINIVVNGERVIFSGQQPIIIDGTTLVPVRGVFESFGFTVDWQVTDFPQPSTTWVTLSNDLHSVDIQVGSTTFRTNGDAHNFPIPPQIINSTTMLPFRALLESVNCEVHWDGASRTISITTPTTEIRHSADGEWLEVERDSSGIAIRTTRGDANSIIIREEYENNARGQRIKTTVFNADGTIKSIMRHEYDPLGRGYRTNFYDSNDSLIGWQIIEFLGEGCSLIGGITTFNADGSAREGSFWD